VLKDGQVVFRDNFDDLVLDRDARFLHKEIRNGWILEPGAYPVGQRINAIGSARMTRTDDDLSNARFEVDFYLDTSSDDSSVPSVAIGGDRFWRYRLSPNWAAAEASVDWSYTPDPASGEDALATTTSESIILSPALTYRLSLDASGDVFEARIADPAMWAGVMDSSPPWTSLAATGDLVAFSVYDSVYALTEDGTVMGRGAIDGGVAEIRSWQNQRGGRWMGICLPELNTLRLGATPDVLKTEWFDFLNRKLGPTIPEIPGDRLNWPISFDVGPDGRIYVLDAGNSRIIVFDDSLDYLTQWGSHGHEHDEFDFGSGQELTPMSVDFNGSIAVGDDGFIYVADVGNQRIQKFAP